MSVNIRNIRMLCIIMALLPGAVYANASAFFQLPPNPILAPGDSCAHTISTAPVCTSKHSVITPRACAAWESPPCEDCASVCDSTGIHEYHSEIQYLDQQVFKGRWYASCGKKPDGLNFDIGYRDLAGRVSFNATLSADIFGNTFTGAPVTLVGNLIKIGPEVSAEATTIKNAFDTALRDTNIWACDSPPGFVNPMDATLLPFNSGAFGNPWCPPGCLPPPTSNAYRYKIQFTRPGCAGGASDVNCSIPEGYYTISLNISALGARVAPADAPPVDMMRPRASGGPVAGGFGLPAPWGLGWEPWATDEWKNVPPLPPPPGPGTLAEQPKCGGTCPNVYNDHPYVWPFVTGEEVRLPTTSPEMFMMGSVQMESSRDAAGNSVYSNFHTFSGTPTLITGEDPLGFIVWYNPSAIVDPPGAATISVNLGDNPAYAPWNSGNAAFPRNLMKVEAIENPKITASNTRPQNIVMGPGTFTTVLNTVKQGYAPYTIHQGMAGNQCALLKAGRKMLTDGAALTSRTSQTLVYVGGCPSNWGAATQYNTFNVNWFASSNVLGGFRLGDLDPLSLALRAINTPRGTNLPTATQQCFTDVGSTANSFVVITSNSCPGLASTATNTAVGSNSSFGCRGACQLGSESTSDCAAKVLQCLSGPARLVK